MRPTMTRRRGLGIVLIPVALVALATGVAGAHKGSAKTKTTFTATQAQTPGGPPTNTYTGRVNSPSGESFNTRCVRKRLVTVTHKGFVLGTTLTSNGGEWTIHHGPSFPPEGDELVATVKKRLASSSNKHKHICRAAQATAPAP
jgi:hypothetical protein